MQLFHLSYELIKFKWDSLTVFSVPDLVSQLRKVMRIKKGDYIRVQTNKDNETLRYKISVEDWTDQEVSWKIIANQIFQVWEKNVSMFIAMPNKREKAELIVQKLTEIWVSNIYFWVSEHSIIRERNEKKADRLKKISCEAVEQSRWTILPKIEYLKSDIEILQAVSAKQVFLANQWGASLNNYSIKWCNDICGVIGPEWWFSESDLEIFAGARIVDLWDNILRMETASIVLAWILKNM